MSKPSRRQRPDPHDQSIDTSAAVIELLGTFQQNTSKHPRQPISPSIDPSASNQSADPSSSARPATSAAPHHADDNGGNQPRRPSQPTSLNSPSNSSSVLTKSAKDWTIVLALIVGIMMIGTIGVVVDHLTAANADPQLHICQDVKLRTANSDVIAPNGSSRWKSSVELLGYARGTQLILDLAVEIRDLYNDPGGETRVWVELPKGLTPILDSVYAWSLDAQNLYTELPAPEGDCLFNQVHLHVPADCANGSAVTLTYSVQVDWENINLTDNALQIITHAGYGNSHATVRTSIFLRVAS